MYSVEFKILKTNTNNYFSFKGNTDDETVPEIFHCMGLSWNFYKKKNNKALE